MIPVACGTRMTGQCKPRASGDDPAVQAAMAARAE